MNLIKRPAATDPEEKFARLAVMEAENEDLFFKKTGFEQTHLQESLIRGKFHSDPDFAKTA